MVATTTRDSRETILNSESEQLSKISGAGEEIEPPCSMLRTSALAGFVSTSNLGRKEMVRAVTKSGGVVVSVAMSTL